MLSSDVVGRIINISYSQTFFPLEDVYVGLLVSKLPDVKPRDRRNHFDLLYDDYAIGCGINNLFLAHKVSDYSLKQHYRRAGFALTRCSAEMLTSFFCTILFSQIYLLIGCII